MRGVVAASVFCILMGSVIFAISATIRGIGGGVNSVALPTISTVKAMPIANKTACRRLLGEPQKIETHREYPAPQAIVAEHWDYFQAATDQTSLVDIVVWWEPDGSFRKIAFRNSETGEVLR